MYIYIKPQKRCEKCGHLVSKDKDQCPYCGGQSDFSVPIKKLAETNAESVEKTKKSIDKKLLKYAVVAAGVVVLIIVGVVIAGSMHLRKSVFEPIEMEYVYEKDKEMEGFAAMCQKVNLVRNYFQDSTAYKDVTYKRLYEFYHGFYNNSDFCNNIRQKAVAEHDEKYIKPQEANFQSVIDKWEEYCKIHDVKRYLQISVVTDYEKANGYYYYEYHPKWYYVLNYPQGPNAIRNCNVDVRCDYDNSYNNLKLRDLKELNGDRYMYYRIDNSRFWDKYSIKVFIRNVTLKDGTVIYTTDIVANVPSCVTTYQRDMTFENKERVIKELVNSEYITQSEYVNNKINQELMAKDALCCKFVNNFMN